jgi:acetyltransferase-like isoleucine patch superfamily enzyme
MASGFFDAAELAELGLRACGSDVRVSRACALYGAERITLGAHVRVDDYCVLSSGLQGYITVGDYVHISAQTALFGNGGIEIGDFCTLSPGVRVLSESDDFSGEHLVGPLVPARYRRCVSATVRLLDYSAIGASSVLLPGVTVGEGVAVGALALVGSDLLAWGVYVGSPARRISERSHALVALAESVREDGDHA